MTDNNEDKLSIVVADTGIELEKAKSIWVQFEDYFNAINTCAEKINGLEITDISQIKEMQLARSTRLELKKIRVEADKKKKELKRDIILVGRFIDATYRLILDATKSTEDRLKEMENFAKRKEAERKAALRKEREEFLAPLGVDTQFLDLTNMTDGDFEQLLEKSQIAYALRLERERKAEEERIAREAEAERIHREQEERERELKEELRKFEAEQARMLEEQLAREREMKLEFEEEQKRIQLEQAERERELERIRAEERAKEEAKRKAAEEAARKEREAREAIERKEMERQAAELRKAQEEKAHIERELRKKQEEEEQARREEKERRRRLEQADDKEKLSVYLDAIMAVEVPTVHSTDATDIMTTMLNCIKNAVMRAKRL